MGVTKRGLGGGVLYGLGAGLSRMAEGRVKRRQLDQIAELEQQKATQQALGQLGTNIAGSPNNYELLTQMAAQNPLLKGMDLSGLKPSNDVLLRPLGKQIQGANKPEDVPNDMVSLAAQLGVKVNDPNELMDFSKQAVQKKASLMLGQQDATAQAGKQKEAEAKGTGMGTAAAAHENAPIATGDKVAEAKALGPVQATNAGLTAGAQVDAQNTPARQQAEARGAAMKAGAETDARIRAEGQRVGLTEQQIGNALQLSTQYRTESQTFKIREESFRSVLAGAKEPSAAGDLAVIFAFMRLLDPGSTVREGEFANAQNAAGVSDQVRNIWNRLQNGERLAPGQREDFIKQAFNNYSAAKAGQQRVVGDFLERAKLAGVPPQMVVGRGIDPELDKEPTIGPVKPGSTFDRLNNPGAQP